MQQFEVDWSKVKKPQLLDKRNKKQQQQQKIQQKEIDVFEKIQICYIYRIASLITALGKGQYYCKFDPKLKKTITKNPIQKSKDELIKKIVTQLDLSSRYVSRSVFQIVRQPLVKSMGIDMREMISLLAKDKEFQKQYEDLDDQTDEQKLKEEQQQKILDGIEQMNEEEIKRQIGILRQKYKLKDDQHLYIMQGEYFDILKEYLNNRGWIEIEDLYSQVYEFKFCYAKKFLMKPILEQVVNRFQNTKLVSTKYGLTRSLKNCFCISGVDSNSFYPKCYDMSDEQDFEDFLEEYKFIWIENYLKQQNIQKSLKKIELCCKLLKRRMLDIKEKINLSLNDDYPVITPDEWKEIISQEEETQEINIEIQQKIDEILEELKKYDPQYKLSLGHNIWVVKPCGLSRGRGVKYYKKLEEILGYTSCASKETNFVVQKCVENIMTIENKKFDIRQWIIISDVQPLQIFMYNEFYVRFCGSDYSVEDLKNRYAHLTNFSVQKHQDIEDTDKLMMSQEDFSKEIIQRGFQFQEFLQKLKNITIATFKSCQKSIEIRKNNFEIFGLDFIVDNDCNPWLIEINSSPTFGQTTPITVRLVQQGLKDLGDFIIGQFYEGPKKQIYGGWEQIYKQKMN